MKTLALITLLFCIKISAQTNKRKILYDGSFTIFQNVETLVDTTIFSYYYQDQKSQFSSELGIISTFDKNTVKSFAETLKEYAQKQEGIEESHHTESYSISIFEFSKNIYISDLNTRYTCLTKKQAVELANEILDNLHLMK